MREWLVHTEQKRTSIYQITKAEKEDMTGKKNCIVKYDMGYGTTKHQQNEKSIILFTENCSSKAASAASDT